jgi:hypothetical protein
VLLARFIEVSKADCEMNLYLIRAKPGPQPSMLSMHVSFLQAHVRSWKPPESEETKAAKAAERAEKAKQKKKVKKEKEENHGADVKSEDDSVEPKCRPWHVTSDKH